MSVINANLTDSRFTQESPSFLQEKLLYIKSLLSRTEFAIQVKGRNFLRRHQKMNSFFQNAKDVVKLFITYVAIGVFFAAIYVTVLAIVVGLLVVLGVVI